MMRIGFGSVVLCALVACGGTSGDGLDDEHATLVLSPATSEHLILNGSMPQQPYTAILVDPAGRERDVTGETSFYVESSFGEFSGATLSILAPGKTTVSALYTDKPGTAQVIARLKSQRVVDDPANPNDDVPPNAPDLFTGGTEDAAKAPTVIYPAADITMPRNLGDFETHWTDASGNDVFEVALIGEFADIRLYVAGNNGVPGAGPRPSWTGFAAQEWAWAVGDDNTVSYQVRGVSSAAPGVIGSAPVRLVKLTNEPMEGGLYYWAATASGGGAYGIFRHDVSKPGQPAEEFMTNTSTGKCVACHALSRDGKTMALTYDGGGGRATIVDVGTKTAQPVPDPGVDALGNPDYSTDSSRWNFATLYPDGSKLITVFNGVMTVRTVTDQSALATMPSAGLVSHPDLSPDSTNLVYVAHTGGSDWSFAGGQIYTRTFDPVTLAFGVERPLVTTGGNNFYPSWSPDGQWIMFNRGSADSYDDVDASLWVVKADGSAPPIQLTAINAATGGLTNSWGRWAPFAQSVGASMEPIFWITVSSKRSFGVRRMNSLEPSEGAKTPQIWMSPFYTARAQAGTEPTTAAFRLPFQSLTSNNHIAQWTERVVVTQ
ncbi:MAG: PD40 domain-containing protein [Deltaproteobacteria bacterium]|nr:PD40 domain-containing protein [Deltaproteobacteria bacterium]